MAKFTERTGFMTENNLNNKSNKLFKRNLLLLVIFIICCLFIFPYFFDFYNCKRNMIITKKISKMKSYKGGHSAVLLKNGDVLLMCEFSGYGIAEIYRNKNFAVFDKNNLMSNRFCAPNYISDEKILIFGKDILSLDAKSKHFETILSNYNRFNSDVLLLKNNNIFIVGGRNKDNEINKTCDIFDSTQNKIIKGGKIQTDEYKVDLTKERKNLIQIDNENVLIATNNILQIYDLTKNKVTKSKTLKFSIEDIFFITKNEKILISYRNENNEKELNLGLLDLKDYSLDFLNHEELIKGYKTVISPQKNIYFIGTSKSSNREIYLYDYKDNKFEFLGNMRQNRFGHNCILLNDGKILITGGSKDNYLINSSDSAEMLKIRE